MKVLLIGASGKVGGIIRETTEAAHDCYYLDRQAVPGFEDRTIIADVNDQAKIEQAVKSMNSVVYLAAGRQIDKATGYGDPDLAFGVNVLGAYRALRAALGAGVRHFVYASSLSVYSCADRPALDESSPATAWDPYGMSKRMGEEVCRAGAQHDPTAVIIALRMMFPATEQEWSSKVVGEMHDQGWHPTGPNDTRRLFAAALDCRQPGLHIVNTTGDVKGNDYSHGLAQEVLGWSPRGD